MEQSQARLDTQFDFEDSARVQIGLRLLVKVLEGRLGTLEAQRAGYDEAVDELTTVALYRINEVLKPSLDVLDDLVRFGFEADRITDSGVVGRAVLQAGTHAALVAAIGLVAADLPFLATTDSPVLTGTPTVPTATSAANDLQAANTAFVQRAIAALVNSAPAVLDTIKELADALGGDANFSTTVMNALADRYTRAQAIAAFRRPRNLFINSGMRISQERGDDAVALNPDGGAYIVDGVSLSPFLDTGRASGQRMSIPTPAGSAKRIRATATSAQATMRAQDFLFWESLIEGIEAAALGWGTPQAKPAVIRLGLNMPAGQYTLAVRNLPATQSYTLPIVITSAEAGTDVVRTFVIPIPPAGTWLTDNGASIGVGVCMAAGTQYRASASGWSAGNFISLFGQNNLMATAGAYGELFDIGLYVGADIPTFELSPLLEEEARCRRYYQRGSFSVLGSSYQGGAYISSYIKLLDSMRAVPTIGLNVGFQTPGVTERVAQNLGADAFRVYITGNSAGNFDCTGDYSVSARL